MKLYIIFAGYYSDRHIVKIFLDKNKAEDYVKRAGDDSYKNEMSISEYDTSDETYDNNNFFWAITRQPYLEELTFYSKELFNKLRGMKFGDIFWSAEKIADWDKDNIDLCKKNAIMFHSATSYSEKTIDRIKAENIDNVYVFFLQAESKEAALKIAHERYMAVKVMEDTGKLKQQVIYKFPSYEQLSNI